MQQRGVGVVGLGVAALYAHLPALADTSEFELIAACDRDPAKLAHVRQRWPVAHLSTDINEFLAVAGLHAVIIATPPDSHYDIARAAISRGKHVLSEKPLARSVVECKTLVGLAARNNVCLMVGHEKRFHPTMEKIRALLEGGEIGKPYYCGVHWASNAKMDPDHLVPDGFRPGYEWRWRNPTVGGGIVQDHLPHYGDLMRYWMQIDPVAIYAQTYNVARDLLKWPADESVWEDMGLVVVRFSNGFTLRFETGTVGRSLSPLWAQGSGIGEWTEYGYVLGSEGQLLFDLLPWDSSENGRIAVWRLKAATTAGVGWSYIEQPEPKRLRGSPAGAAHAMFAGQLREFAKAITGLPHRGATGEDGTLSLAMVECAYESARTHRECPLPADVSGALGTPTRASATERSRV
jgi:predicted dehydrogenase